MIKAFHGANNHLHIMEHDGNGNSRQIGFVEFFDAPPSMVAAWKSEVSDLLNAPVDAPERPSSASGERSEPAPSPSLPSLVWTREKPKVKGWYWFKGGHKKRVSVVHVWTGLFGELRVYGLGEPPKVDDCEGEFAGPLPEPLSPSDPAKPSIPS